MAVARNAEQPTILPVSELSPYHQKWTVKARVTNKGQMRTFNKGRGEGKLLSFELLDAEGGQIRATFFNEAVDKYGHVVQEGKVYLLSGGNVRIANRQYTTINNRYELNFDRNTFLEEAPDDASISAVKLNVTDLRTVQSKTLPCNVDVCAVVQSFKEFAALTSRNGKELTKRDLVIADDSGYTMNLTLWGEDAQRKDSDFEGNPVIVSRGVRITDFNERSGSVSEPGKLLLNPPDVPEVERLRKWWSSGGSTENLTALTQSRLGGGRPDAKQLSLAELRASAETVGTQPEFYTTVARLQQVQLQRQGEKIPLYYLACTEKTDTGRACNRKVMESGECPMCNKQVTPVPRVVTRLQYQDLSDSIWLPTFDEPAQQIFGLTGEDVRSAEQRGDKLEELFQKRIYLQPFKLNVRVRQDTYNGEMRPKVEVNNARPVSYGEHGKAMLQEINEMLG